MKPRFHTELWAWLASFLLLPRVLGAGTWLSLSQKPAEGIDVMLLLNDASVLGHSSGGTERWYRLTPTTNGHYVGGTWSAVAPMHDTRLYFSSQVLTNGNVFVAGGEYGTGGRQGEVYDPIANTWTKTPVQGSSFSDSISEILPNGNVLVAPVGPNTSGGTVIFQPAVNAWVNGPKLAHGGYEDEASWVKLGDNSILTIDPFGTNTERYLPAQNRWQADAPTPTKLYSTLGEMGPAFLLPDGRAFFIGGDGDTLLYTPSGSTANGSWTPGPPIPLGLGVADGPGAMMPNGRILFCAGPATSYSGPAHFFEYDPVANTMTNVAGPTGATYNSAPYVISMLDLPDGNILLSTAGSQLYVYQPDGVPLASGKPVIDGISTNADGTLQLAGPLLNGISEGAAYGDDEQMASNRPLLRFADDQGGVFYGRTVRNYTTSVQTGAAVLVADFEPPGGLPAGTYQVTAVANGISSDPVSFTTPATPPPAVLGAKVTGATSAHVVLQWNPPGLSETGYRVDRSLDGANFSTLASVAAGVGSYTDAHSAALGRYYYRIVATNAAGPGGLAGVCFAATPGALALPSPWQSQDIGDVPGPGASGSVGGVFTVMGAGRPFADALDQLQFAYQKPVGDAVLTAQVLSVDSGVTNTAAGLMFRSGTGAGAPTVQLTVNPAGVLSFQTRRIQDRVVDNAWMAAYTNNAAWIRLARLGDAFVASASPDGVTWTRLGVTTVLMPHTAYAGLAVTSGDERRLGKATFASVKMATPAKYDLVLQGAPVLTNECHTAFSDPGAMAGLLLGRIAAGGTWALGAGRAGAPAAWGANDSGQSQPPAAATSLAGVAAGQAFGLAVNAAGRVFAWGDNSAGQTNAPAAASFQAVAAGSYHALALKNDGSVVQWGDTSRGQGLVPTNMDTILSLSAGVGHSLAMSTGGKLYAWGTNASGQTKIPSVSLPVGVAAGGYHSLALTGGGAVVAWGNNLYHQSSVPTTLKNAVAVAAGLYHSLALQADGTVVAWGNNTHGQTAVPSGLSNVVAVAAGSFFSLALRDDGVVVAWGDDSAGQLEPSAALAAATVPVSTTGAVDANTPGAYPLSYTVADGGGGLATAARTVQVVDTTAPVVTLRDSNPLSVLAGSAFVDPGATAEDACAGDLSAAVRTSSGVNTAVVGAYSVTNSVTDPAGNYGFAVRTVEVIASAPAPVVEAAVSSSGVSLSFPGILGVTYTLLSSSDLTLPLSRWTPLGQAVRDPAGMVSFTEAPPTPGTNLFYRITTN